MTYCVLCTVRTKKANKNIEHRTSRHLFQRIAEHKYCVIGQHLKEDHNLQGYSPGGAGGTPKKNG